MNFGKSVSVFRCMQMSSSVCSRRFVFVRPAIPRLRELFSLGSTLPIFDAHRRLRALSERHQQNADRFQHQRRAPKLRQHLVQVNGIHFDFELPADRVTIAQHEHNLTQSAEPKAKQETERLRSSGASRLVRQPGVLRDQCEGRL